eukprot:s7157_g3.t1
MAAVDRDLQIVLNFAEYQDVYAEWVSGRLSSSEVLRLHGRSVLDLVQSQWAFAAGDTLEAESRAAALGGPSGGGGEVDGTLPDSQELDDWEKLFLNFKAGVVSEVEVRRVLGERVRAELARRWQVYMDGGAAYLDGRCVRDPGPSLDDGRDAGDT